ncbi:MAG: hypothetical protein WC797_03190 [Candidatus Paceibacterota bacterium]|jgi:hypothetical protein
MEALKGTICEFFETGCEGVRWYFFEDGKGWPECIKKLDDGDRLKVFGEKGEILFDGVIEQDREAGWQPYFHVLRKLKGRAYTGDKDCYHGQPCALGHWVHWTQKGWSPDDWARLFFHYVLDGTNGKPLRAELVKKQ